MKLEKSLYIESSAERLTFSVANWIGCTCRVFTNYGHSGFFIVGNTETEVPIIGKEFEYEAMRVLADQDEIHIDNPAKLRISAMLEVWDIPNDNLYQEKWLSAINGRKFKFYNGGFHTVEATDVTDEGTNVSFIAPFGSIDRGTHPLDSVYTIPDNQWHQVSCEITVTDIEGNDTQVKCTMPKYVITYVN